MSEDEPSMDKELERLLEEFQNLFGHRPSVVDLREGPRLERVRYDDPNMGTKNERVRKILALFKEACDEMEQSNQLLNPTDDWVAMAILTGISMGTLVMDNPSHLSCLRDTYLRFFRHVKGEAAMIEGMIQVAEHAKEQEGWSEDWERTLGVFFKDEG